RDLAKERLQRRQATLRTLARRVRKDQQTGDEHRPGCEHRKDARGGWRAEAGNQQRLPERESAENDECNNENKFARPTHAIARHRHFSPYKKPPAADQPEASFSPTQGRGIPNSAGETLVAPLSCSTQVVTDCHFFRNSSASAPEMFMMTLPRAAMSFLNDSDSAPLAKASTSFAFTSSGVSFFTNTP